VTSVNNNINVSFHLQFSLYETVTLAVEKCLDMDVIELRKRFLVEFVTNRFNYHDEDAKRIRESDYWVKRFILHKNQGANAAFYHMKDTFKWKKSFGVHDFNPLDVPREIYQLSPIFSYLPDAKGIIPIYIRCKMIVKIDLLEEKMKQFFAYTMDKVDNQVRKPRGWSLVFDCQGAGIENANFEFLFLAMSIIGQHFPMQPSYVLAYGIPWIMKGFVKMGLGMVPDEAMNLLRFVDSKEELFDIIPSDHVPDFMGGTAQQDYQCVPSGAQSCVEVGKRLFNLEEGEVKRLMEPLQYLLNSVNNNNTNSGHGDDGGCQRTSDCGITKPLTFIEEFD